MNNSNSSGVSLPLINTPPLHLPLSPDKLAKVKRSFQDLHVVGTDWSAINYTYCVVVGLAEGVRVFKNSGRREEHAETNMIHYLSQFLPKQPAPPPVLQVYQNYAPCNACVPSLKNFCTEYNVQLNITCVSLFGRRDPDTNQPKDHTDCVPFMAAGSNPSLRCFQTHQDWASLGEFLGDPNPWVCTQPMLDRDVTTANKLRDDWNRRYPNALLN